MPSDFALPPDLVRAHAASLRALARSLAVDEHAAEDVVQETWLRALSSPPARHDGIGAWLRHVAEGFALKRHRSEGRRADRERRYARERPEAVTSSETRAETLREVVEAVLSLEEPYRETVLLRWFEDLPPRDIAARSGTSVATVNSRLQRAHGLLRERLSRRLGLDARALKGVLLAIFGAGTASTAAAATSVSLLGVTLTMKMFLVAGTAAAALCLLLYLVGRDEQQSPQPLAAATPSAVLDEVSPMADEVAYESRRVELGQGTEAVPIAAVATAAVAGPFVFDLTVVPVDPLGRPVPRVRVLAGLEMQRVVLLGVTGWDGELHATWRGFEPAVDLVIELDGPGTSACALRRIRLAAGSPSTVMITMDAPALEARFVRVTRTEIESSLARPSPAAKFERDEQGNGVFFDPDLLIVPREVGPSPADVASRIAEFQEASLSLKGQLKELQGKARVRRIDGSARVDGSPHIEGIVRDELGQPLPGVSIIALTESARGTSSETTDAAGAFTLAVPHGRAIVFAGGGDRVLVREDVDLAANEVRTLALRCDKTDDTRLRLLGHDGKPLAGWQIEGRRPGVEGMLTGFDVTDLEGRAAWVLPQDSAGVLLGRPHSQVALPMRRIDSSAAELAESQDIRLQEDQRPATFRVEIQNPHELALEARLWRADSGEGIRIPTTRRPVREAKHVLGISGSETAGTVFQATELLPGEYMLEFGGPSVVWKRVGPFFLLPGQTLDAGLFTLEEPAHVAVPLADPASPQTVSVRTHVQGLVLEDRAEVNASSSSLVLRPGAWTISAVSGEESAPKQVLAPRAIQVAPGQTMQIELAEPALPR